MPKIVINEYDKTEAGIGEYANFSVVVPGYLGDNADETVFDENGIYECSSQTDFKNNIGKRAAEIVTRTGKAGTGPIVDLTIRYKENATEEELAGIVDNGTIIEIYYKDRTKFEEAFANLCNNNFVHTVGEETKLELKSSDYKLYAGSANTTKQPVGVLVTADTIYTEVITTESNAAAVPTVIDDGDGMGTMEITGVSAATEDVYYVIRNNNVGKDSEYIEDRITHYGNQMAYELLGLGYTVLYKKMTEYTESELEALATVDDNFDLEGETTRIIKSTKSKAIMELGDSNFWECLRDKSTYDFRYIVTGLLSKNDKANEAIISLANIPQEIALDDADGTKDGRGDCIALIDLDCEAYAGKTQKAAVPCIAQEAAKFASIYAAVFAPYVEYIMAEDADYNNNCVFPGSFHYLACAAASSSRDYAEWYANAGLSRGVSKYTVRTTGCKLGEVAIQALEPRFVLPLGIKDDKGADINTTVAVNLIVNIKGSYYLWGNRTAKKLGARYSSEGDLTAQNFLNVRQLCSTIKKQVYVTCRRLTFDPNSNMLWINFRSLIKPTLEKMKADQGIKDYKFVKNETDRKALLSAKIRIVPIEAVEDFEIGLYLEDNLEDVVVTEA